MLTWIKIYDGERELFAALIDGSEDLPVYLQNINVTMALPSQALEKVFIEQSFPVFGGYGIHVERSSKTQEIWNEVDLSNLLVDW